MSEKRIKDRRIEDKPVGTHIVCGVDQPLYQREGRMFGNSDQREGDRREG